MKFFDERRVKKIAEIDFWNKKRSVDRHFEILKSKSGKKKPYKKGLIYGICGEGVIPPQ